MRTYISIICCPAHCKNRLYDWRTVFCFQSFTCYYNYATLFFMDSLYIFQKSIFIKCSFRHIDQIWSIFIFASSKCTRCCNPSSITSHCLYHTDMNWKCPYVLTNFIHCSCNISCSTSKTG